MGEDIPGKGVRCEEWVCLKDGGYYGITEMAAARLQPPPLEELVTLS